MEVIQIAAAVLLLVGNAFFVAVEFSVTRIRPTMVDQLVADGARGAGALRHAVDHIDNYLSACQLGITVCSIGLGITAEPVVNHALKGLFDIRLFGLGAAAVTFALAYGIVSMFHVVLGELAPKSLAIARTRRTGLVLLPPMRVFYYLTKPVVDLFNWMGNLVLKPFGVPPASEVSPEPHSEAELEAVIAQSERRGLIEPEERLFASGAFRFGDRRAREVIVPRGAVATLSTDQGVRAAALEAAESGHRRLPLCEPDKGLDRPIGVVNVSDLTRVLAAGEECELSALARPLFETPEATLLDDLLEQLRERHEKMALVRDEYGTAVGIVTLEDIVEQIVGDIRDEFDPASEPAIERTEDGCRVPGDARAHHVAQQLELELGDHRAATIGGYLIERLGRVPAVGEEIRLDGASLQAAAVDGSRVSDVLIVPARGEDGEPSAGAHAAGGSPDGG